METLRKKLHSKTGSSLIMTMVYFLFCIFVGGSVLAAATSNAGRLRSQNTSRQSYYTQRSVALLLKEQLQDVPGLDIHLIEETKQAWTAGSETVGATTGSFKVVFEEKASNIAPGKELSPMQLLLAEAAESIFWQKNMGEEPYGKYFQGDQKKMGSDVPLVDVSVLKQPDGYLTFSIDDPEVKVKVRYTCSYEDATDFADIRFIIQGGEDGEKGIFTVSVPASITVLDPVTDSSTVSSGTTSTTTTKKTQTINVRWADDAIIKKGETG